MICECKMGSHDITFCSGLRCLKTETCKLYIGNHWVENSPEGERISIAQFADHAWKCDNYCPMDENKNNKNY